MKKQQPTARKQLTLSKETLRIVFGREASEPAGQPNTGVGCQARIIAIISPPV